jgi:hypothetical protein
VIGCISLISVAGFADEDSDSTTRRGLYVETNTNATSTWTASNTWQDFDAPASRGAGLAWGESSTQTWDRHAAANVETTTPKPWTRIASEIVISGE